MGNRFRDPVMRKAYDALMLAYEAQDKTLYRTDGGRTTLNGKAMMFWRGFDGVDMPWDRASKQTPSYAYWCAGRDAALKEKATKPTTLQQ